MSAEDFQYGCRYRQKKVRAAGGIGSRSTGWMILLLAIVIAASTLFAAESLFWLVMAAGMLGVSWLSRRYVERRAYEQMFLYSRVLSAPHTLQMNAAGVELNNGYEHAFTPWEETFLLEETDKAFVLLPSPSQNPLVMRKEGLEPWAAQARRSYVVHCAQRGVGSK
ncbi:MAG: hypothetical protein LIO46_01820 [Clostridiales bacterium]|nr:hypothetical protein [Clostridiales bacterium]